MSDTPPDPFVPEPLPHMECGECGTPFEVATGRDQMGVPIMSAWAVCDCDPEQPVAVLADGTRVTHDGWTKQERAEIERQWRERGLRE